MKCLIFLLAAGMALSAAARTAENEWREVRGVKVPIPPKEHPRLYLRAAGIPDLKARLLDPVLKSVVEDLKTLASKDDQARVEWNALQYLANRDEPAGRKAVDEGLALLKKTKLEEKQDACRATGRMMVTGATVYDWCYPLLSEDQKKSVVAELVRLAKTMECGYPPAGQSSITGHAGEAQIMRDLFSAGIAIYDEFPEMYEVSAERFFKEHLPARNWFYSGHAYHQGDSYGPYRYSFDLFPLFIFDRLGAGNIYNPEQQFVPYYFIYQRRPDGQRLRNGDCYMQGRRLGDPWESGVAGLLAGSYYRDGYLLGEYLVKPMSRTRDQLFELLWRDTKLQPKPSSELPLTRYFAPPFGWMIARTGWDENAVIAEMKVNVQYFGNHQHLDAGAFQLYYKGALAIDSGLYQGTSGGYGSPHCTNYVWRTIAHNSLLIHDPKEEFPKGYGNDGGQRLPNYRREPRNLETILDPKNGYQTGEVLAHGFGPDGKVPEFSYLKGDLTRAYSQKVKQVVRSFVFLNQKDANVPAAVVVFDRVISSDPGFKKTWLLHSLEEPKLDENIATVDRAENGNSGRLILDVLLPAKENLSLNKLGGKGKEFWATGKNWETAPDAKDPEKRSFELGAWRIEASPKTSSAEDLFLNVMQLTDAKSGSRLPVELMEAGPLVGCRIGDHVVFFSRTGGKLNGPLTFKLDGTRRVKVLVTDLTPGEWKATGLSPASIKVAADAGVIFGEGSAGECRLSR
jgi:heparin/heparan-sulfate lyase